MSTLLEWAKSLFTERSYGKELEAFIISHNPTTPGDVEHWERVFDQTRFNSQPFTWGRGL